MEASITLTVHNAKRARALGPAFHDAIQAFYAALPDEYEYTITVSHPSIAKNIDLAHVQDQHNMWDVPWDVS